MVDLVVVRTPLCILGYMYVQVHRDPAIFVGRTAFSPNRAN